MHTITPPRKRLRPRRLRPRPASPGSTTTSGAASDAGPTAASGAAHSSPQAYPQQAYPQQAYPQIYPPQPYPQQYRGYPQPYPPVVYVTQPARPATPQPRRTLMIAGVSVLLASYGVAVISGAALVDSDCCEDVGWALLIPVAGPYIAAGVADDGKGLLVLLGTIQVVGLGLTVGGAVQYALTKNAARTSGLSFKLPRGGDLSLDMSASPRLLGPAMRVRF